MNPRVFEEQTLTAHSLFQAWLPNLQEIGPVKWAAKIQENVGPLIINLVEDWALCSMKISDNLPSSGPSAEHSCFSRLLQVNHRLEGGVKFAVYPPRQVWLSAALFIGSHTLLPQSRVKAVMAGFHQALQIVESPEIQEEIIPKGRASLSTASEKEKPPYSMNLLQELLSESGWALSEYRQQDIAISLPVKQGISQAHIGVCGPHGALTVPLCGLPDLPLQRGILAWLMLRVSGQVRNVRAVICPQLETDPLTVGFQALLNNPLTARDTTQGLVALTVAYDLGAAEIRLLSEDFSVAEFFAQHQSSALHDWRAINHKEGL